MGRGSFMASEDFILKPVIGKQIKLFAEILGAFNGGFESGLNGAMPQKWADDQTVAGTFSPFVASNTDPTHSGSFCAKNNIVGNGVALTTKYVKPTGWADHMEIGLNPAVLTKGWPVIPKYKYMMEAWGKKSFAGHDVKTEFKWYDGTGLITHSPSAQVGVSGVGAFEKIYCIDYAPSNAKGMNGLVKFNGNANDTGMAYVDDVKLWVPLGICNEIKIKTDPDLTAILEWGSADPVENKEKANSYSGSFKNFYFSLYAWYLAKRLTTGALPEFTLRVVMEQGTDRRVLNLNRCKLGAREFGASVGEMAGESYDFKFIGMPDRESGGLY